MAASSAPGPPGTRASSTYCLTADGSGHGRQQLYAQSMREEVALELESAEGHYGCRHAAEGGGSPAGGSSGGGPAGGGLVGAV